MIKSLSNPVKKILINNKLINGRLNMSSTAIQRILKSSLKEVVTTNTISRIKDEHAYKIRRLSVAPLIAEAVKRIDNHSSVSSLFN